MNFELIAEQCLMERYDDLERVWRAISKCTTAVEVEDVMRQLIPNGLFSDEGNFSLVFKSPSSNEFVLKLSTKGYDVWPKYAQMVSENELYKTNPLFPVIPKPYFKILPNGGLNGNAAIGFIEYLEMDKTEIQAHLHKAVEELPDRSSSIYAADPFIEGWYEYEEKGTSPILDAICKYFKIDPVHMIDFFNKVNPLNTGFRSMDLHAANIGYRKNGEIVLFDPLGYA